MKIQQIGSNQTELTMNSGTAVLFSYNTPVAVRFPNGQHWKTKQKWSVTTSRHINKWLAGTEAKEVDQSEIDGVVK